MNKPSRVLEKGGYKCEGSSTKIQPFLLFFSHLFLVVFSPVSAFSTFPFLHSWGRWFEVPGPVQKKCFRISVVLLFNSPRSHCSSTIAKLFIFIWQNLTFKNSKQISGSWVRDLETCAGKIAWNVASFPSSTQLFSKFAKVLFSVIHPARYTP